MVFLLVDGSVPVQPLDIDCANWLADAKVPLSIVFTKIDKRKKRVPAVQENIDTFTVSCLHIARPTIWHHSLMLGTAHLCRVMTCDPSNPLSHCYTTCPC